MNVRRRRLGNRRHLVVPAARKRRSPPRPGTLARRSHYPSGMRTTVLALGVALGVAAGAHAADRGTLAGVVRLEGPAPARPALPVYKNAEVCGADVRDDRLVVGPGGGLRYAVVTVEGVRGGDKPERDATHLLDNRHCRFEPHVQVAEVGQWLEIANSDPVLHNADARLGSETLFNLALPPNRRVRRPLGRAGRIAITCDVRHTWMSAFVVVAEHPYHTVTDAYGAYEIRDVPSGRYTMSVWHEELGAREVPVTIEAGGTTTTDVVYPANAVRP